MLIGSNAGSASHPLWYLNLSADPRVEVMIGRCIHGAEARELEGSEREAAWKRAVDSYPAYAAYGDETDRTLPVVSLRLGPAERLDLGHRDGSRVEERGAAGYPCDRWMEEGGDAYFRAIDIKAPTDVVFRWLCQLRVAPYSYDWIDNFGRRSPRGLTPGLDRLELGQRFMTIFELVDFEEGRQLTIRIDRFTGIFGTAAVSYVLSEEPSGTTRLKLKIVVGPTGRSPIARGRARVMPWADLAMSRKQLRTLKLLAERTTSRGGPARCS